MLMLVNKKELMGDYRNSRWMNVVTYGSTAIIISLNIILFYNTLTDMMK
jgi:Mn2+/Fe2+ NRAMP family transporter